MKHLVMAVGLLASPAHALIGYGIKMYHPLCAFSCRASISPAMLECTDHSIESGGHMSHGAGPTSPECRAGNSPFLTTMAYCINSTCEGVETWELERYWAKETTGDPGVLAMWTYSEALREVKEVPTSELPGEEEMLEETVLVGHELWFGNLMAMKFFEEQETLHARYGIVLLVVGFATPIVFTLLGYLPFMSGIFDKMKPYIGYPTTIGTYHVRPLPYRLGNAPLVGQSLYVAMFFILNLVLSAVSYRSTRPVPNLWFATTYQEIMAYVSCRTGVLAFALAPLVILFSGRNNILLWLTNWSHSTFMLLHRWVARIFAIQVIVHSIVELVLYIDMGEFAVETKLPYWIWGIVATLATCIMLVTSLLYMRRWSYEVFLLTHIVLAIFVLVGSWYHVELLFHRKWGYELWLYAAFAVWTFDRLMRIRRITKNGIRRATVTEITPDIVRVDVKAVRWAAEPGMHTYAYFPALSPLKPWENHPFSYIPTALLRNRGTSLASSPTRASPDVEKSGELSAATTELASGTTTAGVSLYIRKSAGITKFLQMRSELVTLLDGPYPNNPTRAVRMCDRLLLIGGGIGITALLPFVAGHVNVKLYWSVRQSAEGLVTDLEGVLKGVEKEVRVGRRLEVERLLEEEAAGGWGKIGVVVCGPGGLCDDVRAIVARNGRRGGTVWELEVDAFSW